MSAPPTPDTDGARFSARAVLGEGAMATVYLALDEILQVERAVKVLSPRLTRSAEMRARFLSEARTMARLKHPHLVNVVDAGVRGEQPFLVMEVMRGGSLDQHIHREGALPASVALLLTRQVLTGLQVAHDAGVIHRDVKPHNVLLGLDGAAKVTDFGIAQVAEDISLTRTGIAMGTLAFTAPEQRKDAGAADARADVFGAGTTLYFLLTGQDPFDLYVAELREKLFCDIPADIAQVILRACRFDRDARYPTVEDMGVALDVLMASREDDLSAAWPELIARVQRLAESNQSAWDNQIFVTPIFQPSAFSLTPPPSRPRAALVVGALVLASAALGAIAWSLRAGPDVDAAPAVVAEVTDPGVGVAAGPSDADAVDAVDAGDAVDAVDAGDAAEPAAGVEPAGAAGIVAAPVASSPPAVALSASPPPPAIPAFTFINSRPWSQVEIDGQTVGRTAWRGILLAGGHRVVLTTRDGQSHGVTLQSDGHSEVRFCWDFGLSAPCAR